jgi:hypothetical protein
MFLYCCFERTCIANMNLNQPAVSVSDACFTIRQSLYKLINAQVRIFGVVRVKTGGK